MIPVTDEMVTAFGKAWDEADRLIPGAHPGTRRRAGIAAVLAIVERDIMAHRPKTMDEVMREAAGEVRPESPPAPAVG